VEYRKARRQVVPTRTAINAQTAKKELQPQDNGAKPDHMSTPLIGATSQRQYRITGIGSLGISYYNSHTHH
jgi:hypothetical protein